MEIDDGIRTQRANSGNDEATGGRPFAPEPDEFSVDMGIVMESSRYCKALNKRSHVHNLCVESGRQIITTCTDNASARALWQLSPSLFHAVDLSAAGVSALELLIEFVFGCS